MSVPACLPKYTRSGSLLLPESTHRRVFPRTRLIARTYAVVSSCTSDDENAEICMGVSVAIYPRLPLHLAPPLIRAIETNASVESRTNERTHSRALVHTRTHERPREIEYLYATVGEDRSSRNSRCASTRRVSSFPVSLSPLFLSFLALPPSFLFVHAAHTRTQAAACGRVRVHKPRGVNANKFISPRFILTTKAELRHLSRMNIDIRHSAYKCTPIRDPCLKDARNASAHTPALLRLLLWSDACAHVLRSTLWLIIRTPWQSQ